MREFLKFWGLLTAWVIGAFGGAFLLVWAWTLGVEAFGAWFAIPAGLLGVTFALTAIAFSFD